LYVPALRPRDAAHCKVQVMSSQHNVGVHSQITQLIEAALEA